MGRILLEKETPRSFEVWEKHFCPGWEVILGISHPGMLLRDSGKEGRSQVSPSDQKYPGWELEKRRASSGWVSQ